MGREKKASISSGASSTTRHVTATVTPSLAARLGFPVADWPDWAVGTFAGLLLACATLAVLQSVAAWRGRRREGDEADADAAGKVTGASQELRTRFRRFQFLYLAPFLTVMLSDWLQGTNMYTLYQSYGVNVGALFLTGFSSGALFGTFLGLLVDRFGRRAGCMVFCVLELVINALEHYPNMALLLVGRVLGGLSTSLLFSAFESWMVCEHRRRGFPEEWLAATFSVSTMGNGVAAIVAGVVAQLAADRLGDIGPFQVALVLTALALAMLFGWTENYGAAHEHSSEEPAAARTQSATEPSKTAAASDAAAATGNGSTTARAAAAANGTAANGVRRSNGAAATPAADKGSTKAQSAAADAAAGGASSGGGFGEAMAAACGCVASDPRVLLLGLVQSLFEGAMYTFVFMWVPTLQGVAPDGKLPTGLVFSSFMVCITTGGMLVPPLLHFTSLEAGSTAVFTLAALAMAAPATAHDLPTVLAACLVLETCVGAFFALSGLMRAKYIPDGLQSSVMNLFRLPLNILVVVGTLVTDRAAPPVVFGIVSLWFATAAVLQARLWAIAAGDARRGPEGSGNRQERKSKVD